MSNATVIISGHATNLPPQDGAGLLQVLDLLQVPVPVLRSQRQLFQLPQSDQAPCTVRQHWSSQLPVIVLDPGQELRYFWVSYCLSSMCLHAQLKGARIIWAPYLQSSFRDRNLSYPKSSSADILDIVDTQHNLDNQRTYSLSAKTL